ncbi:MAG: metal ABC transporter substrate-binding protein [Firmicutes bacterium]|nr:metal ABC transporter substrate-binding protein [Bacillota bacterium]
MMKTKKARRPLLLIFILIFVPAFVLSLSGCSRTPSPDKDGQTILVCGFAQYDWVNNILGENPSGIAVERLNESSADMHSYQPTVADMVKIADCSLLIYTGGESEFWIDEAILSSGKTDSSCLSLMEIFEGAEMLCENYSDALSEHEHEHEAHSEDEHEHEAGSEDEHEHEADEHLWLSLKMAPVFIEKITESICALDETNTLYYRKNSEDYIKKITDLDSRYESVADGARKTGRNLIIVADRFPFAYLTEDYHIEHIAAFPGCSAETEASFATILSLSDAVDRYLPGAVLILKKSSPDLAHTVINNSDVKDLPVLFLDDMQSVTPKDIEEGCSYISVSEDNLAAIRAALGTKK